jgi:hypothetical protein
LRRAAPASGPPPKTTPIALAQRKTTNLCACLRRARSGSWWTRARMTPACIGRNSPARPELARAIVLPLFRHHRTLSERSSTNFYSAAIPSSPDTVREIEYQFLQLACTTGTRLHDRPKRGQRSVSKLRVARSSKSFMIAAALASTRRNHDRSSLQASPC